MRFYLLSILLCLVHGLHAQVVCSPEQAELVIEIMTDRYGYETSWELTGSSGTRYKFLPPFSYKNQRLHRDTLCLPANDCFAFTIYDVFGDGIDAPGYYLVRLNGDTLQRGGIFYKEESLYLNCPSGMVCAVATSITPGTYTAAFDDTWYEFIPDTSGIYRISTRNLNTCDTKIWVYTTCDGITIAEDNQSTVFYNDNATAQTPQAEVRGFFTAGKTYRIRMGDHNNACRDSIRWNLTFEGPLRGCTNPNACNYNPLATINDGSCLLPGDRRCPKGPDLLIRQDTLLQSIRLDTIHSEDLCLIQEGCVRGYGVRNVLRFTTQIHNIGERDYYIGKPNYNNNQFTWNNCHNHFHYDNYAEYLVIDESGKKMPIGFKSGLCITDFGCEPGYNPKYSCDNMGISAHCFDAYWSALKCQWIDITDLPDGRYTLVVRINWKNSPDALGQVEKDLDNNIAQVCIRLDRSSGTLKCTVEQPCDPYLDCAGIPFGETQPDCLGICGGKRLSGDANENGLQEIADAEQYITLLLGNDIEPNACNDLNGDSVITVQDAVLLASCLNFGAAHPHEGAGIHNHCQFPVANLFNTKDTVTLGIMGVNWEERYVDIGILNHTTNITAYQFRLTGGSISHVESLVDAATYPVTLRTNMSEGMVIGLSYRDSVIHKSELMQPLCRIHFFNLNLYTIVIQDIISIVNNNYERVANAIINGIAVKSTTTHINNINNIIQVQVRPNPIHDEAQFAFYSIQNQYFTLEIVDLNGKIVRQYVNLRPPGIRIKRDDLPAGIYFYKLIGERSYTAGKFIIQ
ncbi:MAG: lysyl oxidase family protein [Saprospiraceae bacterium]